MRIIVDRNQEHMIFLWQKGIEAVIEGNEAWSENTNSSTLYI